MEQVLKKEKQIQAKPIMKWAGGKTQITPVVIADFVLDLGNERGTGAFGSTGE